MGVVARLNVVAVEHTIWSKTYRMQPVVASQDRHDEEIKQFFAATPGGSVAIAGPVDEELFAPGDQCYLYIDAAQHETDLPFPFAVNSVKLANWATTVEFEAQPVKAENGSMVYNGSKMSFSIRNETAAEYFQPGSVVYVRLEKVDAA